MIDFVATEPTWVVLTERAELLQVDVGLQFTSNQVCEVFTDEVEARAAAVAAGWVEPDDQRIPSGVLGDDGEIAVTD
jgi:hypothetical protein